jgi:ribosome-associated protein
LAEDKKAEDIVALDLRNISNFTDFFVICSATSEPHMKAIQGGVREGLRSEFGISPFSSDGTPLSHWMIIDYSSVIIHVFDTDTRQFYSLESLWSDAPRLK